MNLNLTTAVNPHELFERPQTTNATSAAHLEIDAPVSLLQRRVELEHAIRQLRAELHVIDDLISEQMQEQGIREMVENAAANSPPVRNYRMVIEGTVPNSGRQVAVLEPQSDRARVERDWLLGLLADGTLTPGEAKALMAAEVRANLRGWDMLERRGLAPQEHGSREPQPAKIVIKERK